MLSGSWMAGVGPVAVVSFAVAAGVARADVVYTVGGQTNVLLDLALLQSAASLQLTGISDGVITPGNLGPNSVAFTITSPVSSEFPTTFRYDPADFFGTFAGSINQRGTVTFNNTITVGNFEIFFDNGFKVADRQSGLGVLFDIAVTSATPTATQFNATGNLLVSSNFAAILQQLGLASSNLTGADVGDASIQGFNSTVPAPGAVALLGLGSLLGARRRRR